MARPNKTYAQRVDFFKGVELLGKQSMTINAKRSEIEITAIGVKLISKTTKRVILVPWSNIQGVELYPATETAEE